MRSDRVLTPSERLRADHLQIMLDLDRSLDRKSQIDRVIAGLQEAVGPPPADPAGRPGGRVRPEAVDVHYLAVLQHAIGDHEAAATNYAWALALYAEETRHFASIQALEALCRSDLGVL